MAPPKCRIRDAPERKGLMGEQAIGKYVDGK
jgi:hypothetical protein